ncbi:MAG TPA: carboxypeptidase regulatory-like domain-containing protein [Terriglobales bacterium]|nr:carboxypeptidase regulatory-like domain-containing protein [Terriglobales bacterium]
MVSNFRSPSRCMVRFSVLSLTAAMVFLSATVYAQTSVSTGTILGTVTDPSGAVVTNAKVVITNKATGQVISTTTGSSGTYTSGSLIPGEYLIKIEAKGFKSTVLPVTVQVSGTAPGNVRLELGQESQIVEVQGSAEQVNTEQATVQGVVTTQQIEQLPMSRNFLDLAQLQPGIQIEDGATFDPTKNGFSSISIGGRAGRTARIEVDGLDISDENVGTTTQNITVSSIQEFQIGQSSLDLSSELTSSGTVNVVTKSGTNNYHGSLFGNFRDKRAGGANLPAGQDLPFQRNDYGGSFGGPVVKDRLFFFLAAEHFKQDLFAPVALSAPFSALSGGYSSAYRETELNGRLDYQLHWHSARLFYKFTYDNNSIVAGFGGSNFSPFKNRDNTPAHAVGFDFNTGTFTHSIRFAYNYFHNAITDAVTGTSIFNPAPAIQMYFNNGAGFVSGPNFLAPQTTIQSNKELKYDGSKTLHSHIIRYGFGLNKINGFAFASFFGLAPQIGLDTGTNSTSIAATGPFPGGISNPLNYPVDSILIGNGFGCFTEKSAFGSPCGGLGDNRIQFYVGDSWKARPNFDISFGLRYVRDTGRQDSDLAPIPCSATTLITCTGNLLDQFGNTPGLGNRIRQPNLNFAPQLGIAWDPIGNGKTVIRAGAGLYYDNTVFNNILFDRVVRLDKGQFNAQPGDPCASGGQLVFPDGSVVTSVDGLNIGSQICGNPVGGAVQTALGDLQKQFQANAAALGANSPNPFFLGQLLNGLGSLFAPNFMTPRSVQMNVGLQRELHRSTVFSADYVRNVATHFLLGYDTNHIGDPRFLNMNAALNALNATVASAGCAPAIGAGASSQAAVDCYIAAVPGASITDFAGNGLDSGAQYLAGFPAVLFGLTPDTGAAFPGINPNVGRNTMYFPAGRSVYNGLQMSLRSQISNPARAIKGLNLQVSYALSSFKSNVPYGNGIGDQDFLPLAGDFNNHTKFFGPASQDRRHQISFGTILEMPLGARFGFIGHFNSPFAQSLWLPSGAGVAGEVFRTDVTGDGAFGGASQTSNNGFGDILPGTQVGAFGRDVSASGLNGVINSYLSKSAGQLTPAGQALVTAGLFTQSQLVGLGAVTPGPCNADGTPVALNQPSCVATAPAGNVGLAWLRTFDLTFAWPIKIKERITIEPSVSAFNIFNFANFDGPTNKLGGILNGAVDFANGTTVASRSATRIGAGSGVFALGAPRQMEFGLKFTF